MQNALDYRSQYGNSPYQNPYGNPLSVGQWLMIGAGAIAVGGLAYWGYAKYKAGKASSAANEAAPATTAGNPYNWQQAA